MTKMICFSFSSPNDMKARPMRDNRLTKVTLTRL
jgi:hypothetical protein